jgi:protein-S-isoprenylcysteine O-methyltransferase Ste14
MTTTDPFRDTAGVIAPPPLIALACVLIGLVLDWLMPLGIIASYLSLTVRLLLGGALFAAGVVLAVLAERRFRAVGTNVPPWRPTLALATAGIYRRVRNPMYVGAVLGIGGIAIMLASDWMLILLAPMALILHGGVVLREERYLEAKFGEAYRHYKSEVPRYGWRA